MITFCLTQATGVLGRCVCYFGVAKNDAVLVLSRALGEKPLELHVNRILERTGLLRNNVLVVLSDEIAQVTRLLPPGGSRFLHF